MIGRSQIGAIRRSLLCSVHKRNVVSPQRQPIVSFTFDDAPRSAYVTGGSILRSFGAHGTYYVAPGLIGTENHLGEQLRIGDLQSLLGEGHELASHTYSHCSCRETPFRNFEIDVQKARLALHELSGAEDSGNFAYPYGHVTVNSKKNLGTKVRSCRSTVNGINTSPVDLNLLRANPLYGDVDVLDRVERLFRQNEERRGWLIFYSHDVRPAPSKFGCTPELLESAVAFTAKHNSRILTVSEALEELGA